VVYVALVGATVHLGDVLECDDTLDLLAGVDGRSIPVNMNANIGGIRWSWHSDRTGENLALVGDREAQIQAGCGVSVVTSSAHYLPHEALVERISFVHLLLRTKCVVIEEDNALIRCLRTDTKIRKRSLSFSVRHYRTSAMLVLYVGPRFDGRA
jgi:hypothetical protein